MSLMSDIQNVGKPYQSYTVKHGFEKIEVLVPLNNAPVFEEQMKGDVKSRDAVLEIVRQLGGMEK